MHHLLRLVKDAASDYTTVRDDEHEFRGAVIKREAARMEFVVNIGGLAVLKAAVDRTAEFRRDVAGGSSGAKLGGMKRGSGEEDADEGWQFHASLTA